MPWTQPPTGLISNFVHVSDKCYINTHTELNVCDDSGWMESAEGDVATCSAQVEHWVCREN